MFDPRTSRFWQATILSGLMDAEGLAACWKEITPEKRNEPDHIDRRLARQAVQSSTLTLWQAQQLLAGRTGGFKVDRYILLDLIGQGGMGRVYLAKDTRLNRSVALKILSPDRISNPRAIARFQREARIGAQLQHENLVRIYDFGESSGRYYLVMEYIEGKTIGNSIAQEGPIPPRAAALLVRQVATGLEHLHKKGLIHRDVNPYNILVTRDGTAKLADLGLAIDLADEQRVTRDGSTVGTFDYVAPEQARHSHAADIRSDVYSLGCTLYHMLSAQVPFPSSSLPEKLFAHQALAPTPLSQIVPGLPEGLAEVVSRMMEKSPEARYASPTLVAQALEPFCDDLATTHDPEDTSKIRRKAHLEDEPANGVQVQVGQLPIEEEQFEAQANAAEAGAVSGSTATEGPRYEHTGAVNSPAPAATEAAKNAPSVVAAESQAPPVNSPLASTPFPTPNDPSEEVDSFGDFVLDMGPATSLRGEASPRPKSFHPGKSIRSLPIGNSLRRVPARTWLWTVAAAISLSTGILALILSTRNADVVSPAKSANVSQPKEKSAQPPTLDVATKNTLPALPVISEVKADIVVRTNTGEVNPAPDIYQAIRMVMGTDGWVELRNRKPIKITCNQNKPFLAFARGTGRISVRAAEGFTPVIELDFKGTAPLLETGSSVSLELSGLTFLVRYTDPEAILPPLINAAGKKTRIDRCAFRVEGTSRLSQARALVATGSVLEVDRSWFQGFGTAIDIDQFGTSPALIGRTIFVPPLDSSEPKTTAESAGLFGWGVRLHVNTGAGPQPKQRPSHLILQNVTFEGAGLLDLGSPATREPLQIKVSSCAVRADSLVAWSPARPGQSFASRVRWIGADNLYDIEGKGFIVDRNDGPSNASSSVPDLTSWLRVAPDDARAKRGPLQFATMPSTRTDPIKPSDLAIILGGLPGSAAPGADPANVGPTSKP
jgi:serine/threonine-protein kinase